ncbi:hypothetical protein EXE25_18800 [Acinetobacter bouvetii]|uniref:DUF968 domain-containing protein n=1 Tax=Acinetobacter bouvetii TaxID=202951 RepID=A0A4Q7AP05_9GAMM|nr:hypothetical protein [Acinetobacter bouvetii]RZG63690.1 hypothetical protein EXE25_18800 [Acinetobacter bouvetii]
MRSPKRLAAVRSLPYVRCGNPDSQAAHSNSAKHGKGRGIKADDQFTVPLCHSCHSQFDQYKLGSWAESEKPFEQWLVRVNRMLVMKGKEVL